MEGRITLNSSNIQSYYERLIRQDGRSDERDVGDGDEHEFGSYVQNTQPGAGTRLLVYHRRCCWFHSPSESVRFLSELGKVSRTA